MKLCLIATLVLLTACSADAFRCDVMMGCRRRWGNENWGKRDDSEVAPELKRWDWTKKSEIEPVKRLSTTRDSKL